MGSTSSKVHRPDADNLVVDAGGTITINTGGALILPTTDPHVVGAWWDNNGTITKSAG